MHKTISETQWKTLTTTEQVDAAIERSNTVPIAFFKHSVTCGISAGAHSRLHQDYNIPETTLEFYYLDLLAHRNVSNYIADKLGIIHQSPQIIVVNKEVVVYHTSHHAVNLQELKAAV